MIFLGVRYSFGAGFSMWVEKVCIEKGSAESASPESVCLDVKSSVILSSGCSPGFLSRGISRHELYAVRFSWGRTLVAIV